MPELNTILRDRLGAMEDPKDHPDPDTLTAYVEELLPATERRRSRTRWTWRTAQESPRAQLTRRLER